MPGVFPSVGFTYQSVDVAFMDRVSGLYGYRNKKELERIFYRLVPVNKADVLGRDNRIGSDLCDTYNCIKEWRDYLTR